MKINRIDFCNRRQQDVKIMELYKEIGVGQGWAKSVTVYSKISHINRIVYLLFKHNPQTNAS